MCERQTDTRTHSDSEVRISALQPVTVPVTVTVGAYFTYKGLCSNQWPQYYPGWDRYTFRHIKIWYRRSLFWPVLKLSIVKPTWRLQASGLQAFSFQASGMGLFTVQALGFRLVLCTCRREGRSSQGAFACMFLSRFRDGHISQSRAQSASPLQSQSHAQSRSQSPWGFSHNHAHGQSPSGFRLQASVTRRLTVTVTFRLKASVTTTLTVTITDTGVFSWYNLILVHEICVPNTHRKCTDNHRLGSAGSSLVRWCLGIYAQKN